MIVNIASLCFSRSSLRLGWFALWLTNGGQSPTSEGQTFRVDECLNGLPVSLSLTGRAPYRLIRIPQEETPPSIPAVNDVPKHNNNRKKSASFADNTLVASPRSVSRGPDVWI